MKKKNKLVSLLLALIMVLTAIPMNGIVSFAVSASDFTEPTIYVDSKYSAANSTVSVDIAIANNPGIAGATLTVAYDQLLKLTAAANGEAFSSLTFTKPGSFSNPSKFLWDSESGETQKDGTILTLTFEVSEAAQADENLNIEISSNLGDFYDEDMETVNLQLVNGNITIIDYLPGDVNGDGVVNGKDVTLVRRNIVGGYDQTINESAANVNGDFTINGKDVTAIRRHIVGGYGVELLPAPVACKHQMVATEYKAATCTANGNIAYWYCTTCNKYFKDMNGTTEISLDNTVIPAKGHTVVIDPAVAPTDSEPGHTEGSHCSECGEVIVSPKPIPVPEKESHSIIYNAFYNDEYLKTQNIAIDEEYYSFYEDEGKDELPNLEVKGYNFKGWYDGQAENANLVTSIPANTKRNITLYAHWEKVPYKITFYSPLLPKETIIRTIDETVPIPDLNLSRYLFMGWTDVNGNVITMVKPGTENITLIANWCSYRNQTISNDYLSKGPITLEENNQYLFVYDIGKIVNVPLYTVKDFGNVTDGIIRSEEISKSDSISDTRSNEIVQTIVNTTSDSATWTLSKDWNQLVQNTENFSETELKENSILISDGYTHTDGTTKDTGTVKDTGTLKNSNTQTKDLTTTKKGSSKELDIGIDYSAEMGANVEIISAKKKLELSADAKYERHKDTTEEDGTIKDKGTDTYNLTHTNDLTSTTNSTTTSREKTTSEKIATTASKEWGYSISNSTGGSEGTSKTTDSTQSDSNTYQTRFDYSEQKTSTYVSNYSTENAEIGWHRLVKAGTVHVFAVVGFDIATHSYFYYTYSVLDDETYDFYDYCAKNGEYNDYETGVLPFVCPVDIHNYVTERMFYTEGLELDENTGIITGYDGTYTHVNIPDYYSRDNGDGTYSVIKITGIAPGLFKNNTCVESIRLSNYITEIPEDAFAGCTALKAVEYNEITAIDKNAFNGCTSLDKFTIDDIVTSIGENAFVNVDEIEVNATSKTVAESAALCGAKKITIYLKMPAEQLSDTTIIVGEQTEEFTINGYKHSYNNISVVSNSKTTNINGVYFASNKNIPMQVCSETLTLTNVNVIDANCLMMLLESETTNIVLNGNNNLSTVGDNAVLCNNITLSKAKGISIKSTLQIPLGKIYVCGNELSENDFNYLVVTSKQEQIEYISATDFESMKMSKRVIFDATEGTVDMDSKIVMWNTKIGEMPVPTRDYYSFDGWYTADGIRILENTVFAGLTDMTVYAHWTQNPISDWVLESEAPEEAEITSEKWTYTLREHTTSSSSTKDGWIYDGKTRMSWGAEQTTYNNPSNGERNVWTTSESYIYSYTHHWKYYHRYSGAGKWGSRSTAPNWEEHNIDLTYALTYRYSSSGIDWYGTYNCWDGSGGMWIYDGEYDSPNYATRTLYHYQEPVYTYNFHRDVSKESISNPTGQTDVSNVVKFVKYRAK